MFSSSAIMTCILSKSQKKTAGSCESAAVRSHTLVHSFPSSSLTRSQRVLAKHGGLNFQERCTLIFTEKSGWTKGKVNALEGRINLSM